MPVWRSRPTRAEANRSQFLEQILRVLIQGLFTMDLVAERRAIEIMGALPPR